jgi:hypothetical protein
MNAPKFQVKDKVRIKSYNELSPYYKSTITDAATKAIRSFEHETGFISGIFPNMIGSGVNAYFVKLSSIGGSVELFPEYTLQHETELTPETDAVFRDILRDT